MKRPMNRHQDLMFTTMHGQTQDPSLLMYPTVEEAEEEEEEEVAAGLLLLLAIWVCSRAFMAAEPAICLSSRATMQHHSVRIQL